MEHQLPLFPEPEDTTHEIDIDALAARIAANASYAGSEDRTSEAAREQGYGAPVEAPLDETVMIESIPENVGSKPFTIDTRFINGESYICAIDKSGNIISKRGVGNGSPELYELVESEARRKLRDSLNSRGRGPGA